MPFLEDWAIFFFNECGGLVLLSCAGRDVRVFPFLGFKVFCFSFFSSRPFLLRTRAFFYTVHVRKNFSCAPFPFPPVSFAMVFLFLTFITFVHLEAFRSLNVRFVGEGVAHRCLRCFVFSFLRLRQACLPHSICRSHVRVVFFSMGIPFVSDLDGCSLSRFEVSRRFPLPLFPLRQALRINALFLFATQLFRFCLFGHRPSISS